MEISGVRLGRFGSLKIRVSLGEKKSSVRLEKQTDVFENNLGIKEISLLPQAL